METRDSLREKGWNEEQITDYLNLSHTIDEEKKKIQQVENNKITEIEKQNAELQKQLDEINKSKMSEQEQIELAKKQTQQKLSEANKIYNKAKAKEILAGYDIEDELLNNLVSDDENITINNANLLKSKFSVLEETIEKRTKESLSKIDVKPNPTNIPQGDDIVTKEKFDNMSMTEQKSFKNENPETYYQWYPKN